MFAKSTWFALGTLILAACGPASENDLDRTGAPLISENGLTRNGLTRNGLTRNGLTRNGLTRNGLTRNGLSSYEFRAWFEADPDMGDEMMVFVAKCALPKGQVLTYASRSGTSYTWPGTFGLAPVWASGLPIPDAEQELMTACLAAHVNKFGVDVEISLRGYRADWHPIPTDPGEEAYAVKEACFFGNLFEDDGIFIALDEPNFSPDVTTPRGCAIEAGVPGDCPPMEQVGLCNRICLPGPNGVWTLCFHGARAYRPITTRLEPSEIFQCGDGVCQFTESAYDPAAGTGCAADCGTL